MNGVLKCVWRVAKGSSVLAAVFCLVACSTFEESGLPGSASSMARNQMMFVREQPPTFGHYRLVSLAKIYPDLGFFVKRKGLPDFLAETANGNRNYYILYYLERREAFACRTRPGQRGTIEVAGPYPVTDKEYKALDGFRKREGM